MDAASWQAILAGAGLVITALSPVVLLVINNKQARALALQAEIAKNTADAKTAAETAAMRAETVRTDLLRTSDKADNQLQQIHTLVNSRLTMALQTMADQKKLLIELYPHDARVQLLAQEADAQDPNVMPAPSLAAAAAMMSKAPMRPQPAGPESVPAESLPRVPKGASTAAAVAAAAATPADPAAPAAPPAEPAAAEPAERQFKVTEQPPGTPPKP